MSGSVVGTGANVFDAFAVGILGLGRWLVAMAAPCLGAEVGAGDEEDADQGLDKVAAGLGRGEGDGGVLRQLAASGFDEFAGRGETKCGVGVERAEDGSLRSPGGFRSGAARIVRKFGAE